MVIGAVFSPMPSSASTVIALATSAASAAVPLGTPSTPSTPRINDGSERRLTMTPSGVSTLMVEPVTTSPRSVEPPRAELTKLIVPPGLEICESAYRIAGRPRLAAERLGILRASGTDPTRSLKLSGSVFSSANSMTGKSPLTMSSSVEHGMLAGSISQTPGMRNVGIGGVVQHSPS